MLTISKLNNVEVFAIISNFHLIVSLLVPGILILFVRSQFVTGRKPSSSEAILLYLIISFIYHALVIPFADFIPLNQESGINKLEWLGLIVVIPIGLGTLLGINAQKNIIRSILRRCNLNLIHSMPTAWDWKFATLNYEWILVTLKDGTRFAGFSGPDSFASSEPAERDILIQWIYDVNDKNEWSPRGETSVLITAGEIRTIEFWPYNPEEKSDDQ